VAIDSSSRVYAATLGGVFRSDDGGESWTALNAGLTFPSVAEIAVGGKDSDRVYGFTGLSSGGIAYGAGLFRRQSGESWTAVAGPNVPFPVDAVLAVDPDDSRTVYAGFTYDTDPLRGGIFKSVDTGENWRAITPDIESNSVRALTLDPKTPSTLYAILEAGIFKSTDRGESWTNIFPATGAFSIALDPSNPLTVYMLRYDDRGWEGGWLELHKSTNGGEEWQKLAEFIDEAFYAIAVDPANPSTLYGNSYRLLRSTDGGATWTGPDPDDPASADGLPQNPGLPVFDPNAPTTAYVATARGIYKSTDGGRNWLPTQPKVKVTPQVTE
jgi:photosystem II stability/assembly factor-like uncharacterized protein